MVNEDRLLISFWRWFFKGTGARPGYQRLINRAVVFHVLLGLLISFLIKGTLAEIARTTILPKKPTRQPDSSEFALDISYFSLTFRQTDYNLWRCIKKVGHYYLKTLVRKVKSCPLLAFTMVISIQAISPGI